MEVHVLTECVCLVTLVYVMEQLHHSPDTVYSACMGVNCEVSAVKFASQKDQADQSRHEHFNENAGAEEGAEVQFIMLVDAI